MWLKESNRKSYYDKFFFNNRTILIHERYIEVDSLLKAQKKIDIEKDLGVEILLTNNSKAMGTDKSTSEKKIIKTIPSKARVILEIK